jgi:uncharacterized protein YecE (DUF72 family)
MAGRIVVGTSSWADPGFVEEWYPKGMKPDERLPYYAERFDGVEVNSTFHAVPARRTVDRWVDVTPDGFTFDVKLHRALSRHSASLDSLPPALRDGAEVGPRGRVRLTPRLEAALAEAVLEATEPLAAAGRLSSFLLQLSPGFSPHGHELDELAPLIDRLALVPVAVELRHASWLRPKRIEATLGWFEAHGAAFVAVDAPVGKSITMLPMIDAVTDPRLAYLRAHGRSAEAYVKGRSVAERFAYRYADDELAELRERTQALAEQAGEVRMMFNNNRGSDAPVAAERMRELLADAPVSAR